MRFADWSSRVLLCFGGVKEEGTVCVFITKKIQACVFSQQRFCSSSFRSRSAFSLQQQRSSFSLQQRFLRQQ